MNNQTCPGSLPLVALIGVLVLMLAYRSFGGGGTTVIVDPAVVCTVNLERVYEAIPQKTAAEQSLEAFGRSLDERISAYEEEIDALEGELEALAPNSESYEQRTAELMRKTLEYEGFLQFANNRFQLQRAEALRDIYLELRANIAQIAQRNGYDLVIVDDTVGELTPTTEEDMRRQISARRMLYGARTIDITDIVIAEMNK